MRGLLRAATLLSLRPSGPDGVAHERGRGSGDDGGASLQDLSLRNDEPRGSPQDPTFGPRAIGRRRGLPAPADDEP